MKFNEIYRQLDEALSDQPIFLNADKAYSKWIRIRNAILTSNETIQVHLEDGTRVDMPLKGINANYRLILNDGTYTDAFTVAGIYGLLQAPKVLAEDDGGGGGDMGGGSMDAGAPMGTSCCGDGGGMGGTTCGAADSHWHTCDHGNYGLGMRGPVYFARAQPLAQKPKRARVQNAPKHMAPKHKSTALKPKHKKG